MDSTTYQKINFEIQHLCAITRLTAFDVGSAAATSCKMMTWLWTKRKAADVTRWKLHDHDFNNQKRMLRFTTGAHHLLLCRSCLAKW